MTHEDAVWWHLEAARRCEPGKTRDWYLQEVGKNLDPCAKPGCSYQHPKEETNTQGTAAA